MIKCTYIKYYANVTIYLASLALLQAACRLNSYGEGVGEGVGNGEIPWGFPHDFQHCLWRRL